MSKIKFSCDWLSAGVDDPAIRDTSGRLTISVGDICLTQCEDIWSKTIRNDVLVSAYPLALWLASSWWRLLYEPLPKLNSTPSVDWRMCHELGAANHGFVWPKIMFATDGDGVQIWAGASNPNTQQSVRYLNSLGVPARVSARDFEHEIESFIGGVLSRLDALGHSETELSGLWALIQEDRSSADIVNLRRLEAQLGFDPEACPDDVIETALSLENLIGKAALSELAPVYGLTQGTVALDEVSELVKAPGLMGKPQFDINPVPATSQGDAPWERAVMSARQLRSQIGNRYNPIGDKCLYELLGLDSEVVTEWTPQHSRQKAAIASPSDHGTFIFKPRKKHPLAQRFEFARFLGDLVAANERKTDWLASTDLSTSRQKFQRAFAAEFLCPIESLAGFLGDDFSETAIEDAASEFNVSERTVQALLANNGYITPPLYHGDFPYRLVA